MDTDIIDISSTLAAKSDQLNADDIVGGPITVRVEGVTVNTGEQPVSVVISGGFKPWKPCKTMRRLLAHAWGSDAGQWRGRWLVLYRDPDVKFGGDTVGGIRVSALSHIPRGITIKLSSTKGKKAEHKVTVLTPPSQDMPLDLFKRHLNLAVKEHGWTPEQVRAFIGGTADAVPSGDRAAIAERMKSPPPAADPDADIEDGEIEGGQ